MPFFGRLRGQISILRRRKNYWGKVANSNHHTTKNCHVRNVNYVAAIFFKGGGGFMKVTAESSVTIKGRCVCRLIMMSPSLNFGDQRVRTHILGFIAFLDQSAQHN